MSESKAAASIKAKLKNQKAAHTPPGRAQLPEPRVYPWLNLPSPTPDRLMAGDVIFFKPRNFNADVKHDFTIFPTVAAFVQSAPYTGIRPWHHIAVCVENGPDPAAIGFGVVDGPEHFGATLQRQDTFEIPALSDTSVQLEIDALRPPPTIAGSLVAIFENQIGTPYALGGLLGFGMAMLARMFPDENAGDWFIGPSGLAAGAKDRVMNVAYGADLVAQALASETCVSHVAKAVAALAPLAFEDVPSAKAGPGPTEQDMINRLLVRLGLEAASKPLRPGSIPSAGHILGTDTYLEALEAGIEQDFGAFTTEQLAAMGKAHRLAHGDTLTASSLLVSPAMLHHALVHSAGFTRVN